MPPTVVFFDFEDGTACAYEIEAGAVFTLPDLDGSRRAKMIASSDHFKRVAGHMSVVNLKATIRALGFNVRGISSMVKSDIIEELTKIWGQLHNGAIRMPTTQSQTTQEMKKTPDALSFRLIRVLPT